MSDIEQEFSTSFEVIALDLRQVKDAHPEFSGVIDRIGDISVPKFLWGSKTAEQFVKDHPESIAMEPPEKALLAMDFLKPGESMIEADRRNLENLRTDLVRAALEFGAPEALTEILGRMEPAYFVVERHSDNQILYRPKNPDEARPS